jgi:tetratricopeptide (TPR) repeat protein
MRNRRTTRIELVWVAIFALGGLLTAPAIAQQQSSSQGSSPAQATQTTQQNQQKAPEKKKTAAQENPFPEDVSEHAAQQQNQQQDQTNNAPEAPDAGQQPQQSGQRSGQQSGQKPGEAAKDNPFPEDVSRGAADAASKANDAGSSSSSSADNGSWSSSSNPDAADPDADIPPDTGRRKLKKPSDADIQSGSLAGEGKAKDDIRIGKFYLGTGNYRGAYGRFSEAARLDPANVDAIYGLAASADGLHHAQEALTNYKLYLEIAPDGDKAKSARKAIQDLSK